MTLDELIGFKGLVYMAVPYTAAKHGLNCAAYDADRHAAYLIKRGLRVFSPISHSHVIAAVGEIDPRSHVLWMDQNGPFMAASGIMVAVKLPGWENSIGMMQERETFRKMGKPVIEMDPLP